MGNAWFVDGIRFVEGADEEIQALGAIDLRKEAVADNRFAPGMEGFQPSPADSLSSIVLADYDSDFISYAVDAKKEELAVFSEIYYPKGWQVTIDGEPVEMLRVNYALRALVILEGVHTVEFRFDPPSIKATDAIAYAALIIMLLTALFLVYRSLKPSRQDSWV